MIVYQQSPFIKNTAPPPRCTNRPSPLPLIHAVEAPSRDRSFPWAMTTDYLATFHQPSSSSSTFLALTGADFSAAGFSPCASSNPLMRESSVWSLPEN